MSIYLFDPVTALAGVAAGAQVIGGFQEAQQTAQNAKAQITDVQARIKNERLSEARELRDLERDTQQNVALMKARAAAGGAALGDVGFQLSLRRELTEREIEKIRIKEDSAANVESLLRLQGNIAQAGEDKAGTAVIGGLAGAGTSLLKIF